MALKVKAVERLLKFSNKKDDPGVYFKCHKLNLNFKGVKTFPLP